MRLRTLISNVLRIPESEITEATSPETVASWDSFNGLMMVSELESTYSVKFTMQEVSSVQRVGDIKKALEKYGARFEF